MNVSIVSSDLSNNCFGRALILADVLAPDHEVRIVGSRFGDRRWPPARGHSAAVVEVEGQWWPRYRRAVTKLVDLLDADVIVAVKPLFPSYGVALRARRRHGVPVVLDIDDDHTALSPLPRPRDLPHALLHPDGAFSRRIMERSIPDSDATVVASRTLQRRFGGRLVRHAKDTNKLRPGAEPKAQRWRAELGLSDVPVVLFLGTPRPWKGLDDAAAAVEQLEQGVLLVVGMDDSPYARRVAQLPRVRGVGMVPTSRTQEVVGAADVVIVPQRAHPVTDAQVPSKLFDAMAMGCPIVATAVSDIPEILGRDRGRVVPPGDVRAIAAALRELLDNPREAARIGSAARQWCVQNASLEAARGPLNAALEDARRRNHTGGLGKGNSAEETVR